MANKIIPRNYRPAARILNQDNRGSWRMSPLERSMASEIYVGDTGLYCEKLRPASDENERLQEIFGTADSGLFEAGHGKGEILVML